MAKLFVPGRLASLSIAGKTYETAEDGTIQVDDGHVQHALDHGCTADDPKVKAAAAAASSQTDELHARLVTAEGKIAALEGANGSLSTRLAVLEAKLASPAGAPAPDPDATKKA